MQGTGYRVQVEGYRIGFKECKLQGTRYRILRVQGTGLGFKGAGYIQGAS